MALSVKGRVSQILKPETGVSKAGKEWSYGGAIPSKSLLYPFWR